jgi:hypothetical protein
MVSTAAHEIWKAKGVYPIIKIEDNLALFWVPNKKFAYNYSCEEALHWIEHLGIP